MDVIISSYRCNNANILRRIISFRTTVHANAKFWIVDDNPHQNNLLQLKLLAKAMTNQTSASNYFVNIVHH
jgi:hypothetical protein